MDKRDFLKEIFPVYAIEDKKTNKIDYALRSELRVLKAYENVGRHIVIFAIRGDDNLCDDATIELGVWVNHNADLIMHSEQSKELIEKIKKETYITIDDGDDADYEFYYVGEGMTYEEFAGYTNEKLAELFESTSCYKCNIKVLKDDMLYSYNRDGEVSPPANLEDTEAQMTTGDELCGPYCPECLTALE